MVRTEESYNGIPTANTETLSKLEVIGKIGRRQGTTRKKAQPEHQTNTLLQIDRTEDTRKTQRFRVTGNHRNLYKNITTELQRVSRFSDKLK